MLHEVKSHRANIDKGDCMFGKPKKYIIVTSPEGKITKFLISGEGATGQTRAAYNAFDQERSKNYEKYKTWKIEVKYED